LIENGITNYLLGLDAFYYIVNPSSSQGFYINSVFDYTNNKINLSFDNQFYIISYRAIIFNKLVCTNISFPLKTVVNNTFVCLS
jgi:hypothetical protein